MIQIDRDSVHHNGAIRDKQGALRWRYRTRKNLHGRNLHNPFDKPDFIVIEEGGRYAEVIIRRARFAPSVFNIVEEQRVVGTIRRRPLLGMRYHIEIDGLGAWTLHMLLFSIRFYAESSAGPEIWGMVGPSKMEWNILMKPGLNEQSLLSALAFIHNERWNYPS